MRRIIRVTALAMMLGGAALPVAAQSPFAPVIYVNDAAVTAFELDQRMRFVQVLGGANADRESVLRELVNDRLKTQAARQIGIEITDEALQQGLAEFAGRANLGTDEFIAELGRAGVEPQSYRDFVRAGIAWREVVRARIVPQINVTDREVEQALTRQLQAPIVTDVLLSELVIPAPPGAESRALAQATEVAGSVRSEADFAAAARRLSATPTAPQGGRLPWTPLDNLAPSLRQIVLRIEPGRSSAPLTVPGAVVLFFVRDTRGTQRAGANDQTVDYLTMALPSAAEGARILSVAPSCEEVRAEARRYAPDPVSRQTVPLGAVPADIAQRLASLDDNEGSVIDYGAGARLVMLCDRTPTALVEAEPAWITPPGVAPTATRESQAAAVPAAPARDAASADAAPVETAEPGVPPLAARADVREDIFNARISAAADAYLAELRADALVRQP